MRDGGRKVRMKGGREGKRKREKEREREEEILVAVPPTHFVIY